MIFLPSLLCLQTYSHTSPHSTSNSWPLVFFTTKFLMSPMHFGCCVQNIFILFIKIISSAIHYVQWSQKRTMLVIGRKNGHGGLHMVGYYLEES